MSLNGQLTEGVDDVIWMHADHPQLAFFLSEEPSDGRVHPPAEISCNLWSKVTLGSACPAVIIHHEISSCLSMHFASTLGAIQNPHSAMLRHC